MRFEQVKRYLASGMSVVEWCKLNHVAESTLYAWMQRYRGSELETELSATQCAKETTRWIKLTREELAREKALACTGSAPTSTSLISSADNSSQTLVGVLANIPTQPPTITVSKNSALVSIPAGAAQSDIVNVLQAVSCL